MASMTLNLAPEGDLTHYLQEIRKFPMLSAEEELALSLRWRDRQDLAAAHKLVTSHLRLVAKMAMGYRGYGLPVGELIGEGNVGLMQAVHASTRTAASVWRPTRCGGSGPPSTNTFCAAGRW